MTVGVEEAVMKDSQEAAEMGESQEEAIQQVGLQGAVMVGG